jgi:hypothetical protein
MRANWPIEGTDIFSTGLLYMQLLCWSVSRFLVLWSINQSFNIDIELLCLIKKLRRNYNDFMPDPNFSDPKCRMQIVITLFRQKVKVVPVLN